MVLLLLLDCVHLTVLIYCAVGSGSMCGWRVLQVAGVGRERLLKIRPVQE